MTRKYLSHLYKINLVIILFFCANITFAANVTFEVVPALVPDDTATIIEVRMNPNGVPINAVEGTIGLFGSGLSAISSIIVETGGSALTLWPSIPEYSSSEKVIRFTGGTPETFSGDVLLFRMRIFSKKPGEITTSWLGGSAYQSDGVGTREGISSRSLTVSLAQNEPNQINAASIDSTPPRFEDIEISQDIDAYDGKYFLSWNAIDDISGIARYEVVEGTTTTEVNNGVYVLHDQERKTKIIVIAYDHAGNSTSIKVSARYNTLGIIVVGVVIMLTLLGVFIIRRRYLKR